MDVLSKIMTKAVDLGVSSRIAGVSATQTISIYADDVAMFVKPSEVDLRFVKEALKMFGDASGLRVNYLKSSAVMIHGDASDRDRVAALLQCNMGTFPCKYLGLQLAIHQLSRADWQPMVDQAKHCAPAWQRGLLQRSGRLVLVKSVVAAKPIHHFMIAEAPAWVLEDIDQWMCAFSGLGKTR